MKMDAKITPSGPRNVPGEVADGTPVPSINNCATSPPKNLAASPPKALRVGPRAPTGDGELARESSPPPHYVVNYSVNYDDLEFYEHLGSGRYGSVCRALLRSRNTIVAVKKIDSLGQEVHILSQLSHRNIVRFYGVYSHVRETPVGRQLQFGIITEFCDNGSLYDLLKRIRPHMSDENSSDSAGLSFVNIIQWAADIARGMNYLHSEAPVPIIHRDLKSTNVLLSRDWMCKICDFGSSRTRNRDISIMSVAGTPAWMAPELIRGQAHFSSCDIWSFGVVLWELLTCEQPFKGLEPFQILFVVGNRSEHPPIPGSCPQSFEDLLSRCWTKEATARPAFSEIIVDLAKMLNNNDLSSEVANFTSTTARKVWLLEVETELARVKLLEQSLEEREHTVAERERQLEAQKKALLDLQLTRMTSSSSQSHFSPLERLDVLNWDEFEVARWVYSLDHCGLRVYADLFEANHISGRRLLLLGKSDFQAMGVTSLGHQKQFMDEINFLRIASQMVVDFPPLQITSNVAATPVNGNDTVFQLGSEDGDGSSQSNTTSTPIPDLSIVPSTPVSQRNSVSNAAGYHTPLSVNVSNSYIYVDNREFYVNLAVGMYSFPTTISESGLVKESVEYRVFLDAHVSFDPSTVSSPDDAIALTDADLTFDIANIFSTVFFTFDPSLPTERKICAATGSKGSSTNLSYSTAPYVVKETATANSQPFSEVDIEIALRQPYCCLNKPMTPSGENDSSGCNTYRERLSSRSSGRHSQSNLLVARKTNPPLPVDDDPAMTAKQETITNSPSFEFVKVIRKRLPADFGAPIVTWSVCVTQLSTRSSEEANNSGYPQIMSPHGDDNSVASMGSVASTTPRSGKMVTGKTPHTPASLASITSPNGGGGNDDPIQFFSDVRRNSISQAVSPNEARPSSPASALIGQQVKAAAANEQNNRLPFSPLFSPSTPSSFTPPVKTYASVAASVAKPPPITGIGMVSSYQLTSSHTHHPYHGNNPHHRGPAGANHHQASVSPAFRHAMKNNQRRTSASSGGSGGAERGNNNTRRQFYTPEKNSARVSGATGGNKY